MNIAVTLLTTASAHVHTVVKRLSAVVAVEEALSLAAEKPSELFSKGRGKLW